MGDVNLVRSSLLDALAEIHDRAELEAAVASAGDDYLLELDSKTAEYLLVAAEVLVGHELPCPADLHATDYNSLGALVDLILREMQ